MTKLLWRARWAAYRRILQRSSKPVLVGPWRGEVGFEILYWLPWLRALGLAPERLITLTRGGAGTWYGAHRGLELFDMRDPRSFRVENLTQVKEHQELKQRRWTAWDRAVIHDARETLGYPVWVLHPHWMFRDLTPFWSGAEGLNYLKGRCLFTKLGPPPLPEGVTLPEKFIAVRFYGRATFPLRGDTAEFASRLIQSLAEHWPVVILDTNVHADDHVDLKLKGAPPPNVHRLWELVPNFTPSNNLALVSAVMGRAQAFVGTYGGLAQLALTLGIPSVSFYSEWGGTAIAHKHLSDAISLQTGVPFSVVRANDTPLLRTILDHVRVIVPRPNGSGEAKPYAPLDKDANGR